MKVYDVCTYFCYRELTEVLGYKHNIEPLAVSGREGTKIKNPNISHIEAREEE